MHCVSSAAVAYSITTGCPAEFGRVNRTVSSEAQIWLAHVQIWLLHQLQAVYIYGVRGR